MAKNQGFTSKRRLAGAIVKRRSVTIDGRNTSITLEDAFWEALQEIAAERQTSKSQLIKSIDTNSQADGTNLSSNIRIFVLDYYTRARRPDPTSSTTEHKGPLPHPVQDKPQ